MPDLTGKNSGKKSVERLPIIVTGMEKEELLAVPKDKSKAASQAEVIYQTVKEWNIETSVKTISFDTTAVNTGIIFFSFFSFFLFIELSVEF